MNLPNLILLMAISIVSSKSLFEIDRVEEVDGMKHYYGFIDWESIYGLPPVKDLALGEANQTLQARISLSSTRRFIRHSPQYNPNTTYGVVILVNSYVQDRAERDEIRRTWASVRESWMQEKGVSLVIFVVGRSADLDEEAATHGDLLQVDVADTHRNRVYKVFGAFRWIRNEVRSDFVAKIDAGTVVHIDRLYPQLRRFQREQPDNDWMACHSVEYAVPDRDQNSPDYIPTSDYLHRWFANYCDGFGYVMKKATMEKIMDNLRYFQEDAYLTGTAAYLLRGKHHIQDITAAQYTDYSNCDLNGYALSMLNTRNQFGSSSSKRDLTAAWESLKNPKCHNFFTRWFYY